MNSIFFLLFFSYINITRSDSQELKLEFKAFKRISMNILKRCTQSYCIDFHLSYEINEKILI
jgi:hypothetical protein